jgi:hypothetical protein
MTRHDPMRTLPVEPTTEEIMARTSSATADDVRDYGALEDRSSELGGYTVNFVTMREAQDMAPMLASLPGGQCACPHWGHMVQGRMVVHYADHDEAFEAGDAFYMPPGHVPEADAGTEFIMFSPTDQLEATEAAIRSAMQAR